MTIAAAQKMISATNFLRGGGSGKREAPPDQQRPASARDATGEAGADKRVQVHSGSIDSDDTNTDHSTDGAPSDADADGGTWEAPEAQGPDLRDPGILQEGSRRPDGIPVGQSPSGGPGSFSGPPSRPAPSPMSSPGRPVSWPASTAAAHTRAPVSTSDLMSSPPSRPAPASPGRTSPTAPLAPAPSKTSALAVPPARAAPASPGRSSRAPPSAKAGMPSAKAGEGQARPHIPKLNLPPRSMSPDGEEEHAVISFALRM